MNDTIHTNDPPRTCIKRDPINLTEIFPSLLFGTYPYEADGTKRPIEWLILKRQGTKALLISKLGIDAVSYNSSGAVTWEDCSLRHWLNNEFYRNAFSVEERSAILETTVTADINPDYETSPGKNTIDKVYLLSISEARDLFQSNAHRIVTATPYAEKNRACVNELSGTGWWWLRSPGATPSDASIVNLFGSVRTDGNFVGAFYDCVRPVIWVDLEKIQGDSSSVSGTEKVCKK